MNRIKQAILQAGGFSSVASSFGITRGAVWQWVWNNRVPAERVLQLENLIKVPRHELRPDIYPKIEKGRLSPDTPAAG